MDLNSIISVENNDNELKSLDGIYSLEELDAEYLEFSNALIAVEELKDKIVDDNITLEELNEFALELGIDISIENISTDLGFDKVYKPSVEYNNVDLLYTYILIKLIDKWTNGTITRFNNIFKELFLKAYYTKLPDDEIKKITEFLNSNEISKRTIVVKKGKFLDTKEEQFIWTFSKKHNKTLKYISDIFKGADVYKTNNEIRRVLQNEKCIERQKWALTKWLEEESFIYNRPTIMTKGTFNNIYSLGIKVADIVATKKFKESNVKCVNEINDGTYNITDLDIDLQTIKNIINNNHNLKTILKDTFSSIKEYKDYFLKIIKENESNFNNKYIKTGIMRSLQCEALYVRKQAERLVQASDLAIKFVQYLKNQK